MTTQVATESSRKPWYRYVLDRWPTAAALLVTYDGVGGNVLELAHALPYLPLLYLVVAKTGRRVYTWPILVGALAVHHSMSRQRRR